MFLILKPKGMSEMEVYAEALDQLKKGTATCHKCMTPIGLTTIVVQVVKPSRAVMIYSGHVLTQGDDPLFTCHQCAPLANISEVEAEPGMLLSPAYAQCTAAFSA